MPIDETVAQMKHGSKRMLLVFHRRFLLRVKFGRRWRGALVDIAAQRGVHATATYISHVISGDWRSNEVEQLIADALDLPAGEVWPEHEGDSLPRSLKDGQLTEGAAQ